MVKPLLEKKKKWRNKTYGKDCSKKNELWAVKKKECSLFKYLSRNSKKNSEGHNKWNKKHFFNSCKSLVNSVIKSKLLMNELRYEIYLVVCKSDQK